MEVENTKYYRKETLLLTLPVFLELLVSSLFGMVDMMMVGNSGDPSVTTPAIAAIGITNQIMFIGISLAQSLGTGGTTMIARYYGAQRYDRIPSVLKHILILAIVLLVIPFQILTQMNPGKLMALIGAQDDAIRVGLDYYRYVISGFTFQAINLIIFSSIRGAGDTRTPMRINLFVNLLNVIGNYCLIFGKFGLPKMGVSGAGLSTSLSHLLASIILMSLVLSNKHHVKLDIKSGFKYDRRIINNLIKVGGPAAIEQMVFRIGVLLYVRIVSGLGTVIYATHQVAISILSLSFAPGQAFGIASSTLVGRSLGQGRIDKADRFIKESLKLSLLISIITFILFFFFGEHITSLYTEDIEVIKMSKDVLKMIAFIQPFQTSQFALSGGLRGAGDTVSTLIMTFLSVLVVRLSLSYFLVIVLGMGLMGAWIALAFDQVVRWIGVFIRYKKGNWKYIKLQ